MQPILFSESHIEAAIALWQRTEHLGVAQDEDHPENIARFLQRNPGCSHVTVCEKDGLIGTILGGHDSRRGIVYHLAVDSARRGEGIASALVAATLNAFARQGVIKCHAFVFPDNPSTHAFWEPQGWVLRNDVLQYSKRTG